MESFTPILNTPQVAILGVGGIALKPIETPNGVEHIPHLALSFTIDHQVARWRAGRAFSKHLRAISRT